MINEEGYPALLPRRKWLLRSALWVSAFALIAWVMVAGWGLSFWPSVVLFAVYMVGIAIPLGAALGVFIR